MVSNHQGDLLFLCFDVDGETGLEFHGEVVGIDCDALDELFDQSLIEFRDVGFLLGNEVLQLLDPVHGLFPVMAVVQQQIPGILQISLRRHPVMPIRMSP